MTLDVTIGTVFIERIDNKAYLGVNHCPRETYDVCDPSCTIYPRDAYRSGSTGFHEFFEKYLYRIYVEMRDHPDTNDQDVAFITQWIDRINELEDECDESVSSDRMRWLKFWCARAVALYGEDAAIEFR